jgi:hypothetical protein
MTQEMRLSQFVLENREAILQQWEDFARSLKPGHAMSIQALRDDAERMLRFVAAEMESAQTRQQEIDKATGHGPELSSGHLSAAHDHGVGRAVERFSLIELVSEYRALRASVTRMWTDAAPVSRESVTQIVRFNEAIDQILAEGVSKFTERIDRDADLFAASVGHDLSNPVNTVVLAAHRIATTEQLSASGLERCGESSVQHRASRECSPICAISPERVLVVSCASTPRRATSPPSCAALSTSLPPSMPVAGSRSSANTTSLRALTAGASASSCRTSSRMRYSMDP